MSKKVLKWTSVHTDTNTGGLRDTEVIQGPNPMLVRVGFNLSCSLRSRTWCCM